MLMEEVDLDEVNNYGYFIDVDVDETEYDYYKDHDRNFSYEIEESIIEYSKESKSEYFNKGKFFLQTAGLVSVSILCFKLWILNKKC
jgi:hypothetical protein